MIYNDLLGNSLYTSELVFSTTKKGKHRANLPKPLLSYWSWLAWLHQHNSNFLDCTKEIVIEIQRDIFVNNRCNPSISKIPFAKIALNRESGGIFIFNYLYENILSPFEYDAVYAQIRKHLVFTKHHRILTIVRKF